MSINTNKLKKLSIVGFLTILSLWVTINFFEGVIFRLNPLKVVFEVTSNIPTVIFTHNKQYIERCTFEQNQIKVSANEVQEVPILFTSSYQLFTQKGISIGSPNKDAKIDINSLEIQSPFYIRSYSTSEITKYIYKANPFSKELIPLVEEDSKINFSQLGETSIITNDYTLFDEYYSTVRLYSIFLGIILTAVLVYIFYKKANSFLIQNSFTNLFISILFLGYLLFFTFGPRTYETQENRRLRKFPNLFSTFLWHVPSKIENWYKDHIPFRNTYPFFINSIKFNYFDQTPIPRVAMKGQNSWLFQSAKSTTDVYKGIDLFTDDELYKIKVILEERRDYLKLIGSSYHLMIVPMKATIYTELLPSALKPYNEFSKYEQLITFLKSNSDISIIETQQTLLKNKDLGVLYYETDTHWNSLGAFLGYQEVIKEINRALDTNIRITKLDEIKIEKRLESSGDLLTILNLVDLADRTIYNLKDPYMNFTGVASHVFDTLPFNGINLAFQHGDKTLSKIMFYRDSFGTDLINPISNHFSRAAWYRTSTFHKEPIDFERPDIFVDEYVEVFIDKLLDENPKGIQLAVKKFRASQQADSLHNSTLPEPQL